MKSGSVAIAAILPSQSVNIFKYIRRYLILAVSIAHDSGTKFPKVISPGSMSHPHYLHWFFAHLHRFSRESQDLNVFTFTHNRPSIIYNLFSCSDGENASDSKGILVSQGSKFLVNDGRTWEPDPKQIKDVF